MKNFLLFVLISMVMVGAWAQPPANRETAAGQTASEQRRAELRSVLKTPRGHGAKDKDQTQDNAAFNRHLSAQERADLRQQLGQQRRDVKPGGP